MNLLNILSFLLFSLSIVCYAMKELQVHGKLKWMDEKKQLGFWGKKSDLRKYKSEPDNITTTHPNDLLYEIAPKTWYYNFFKIKYKEKFPLSATALVFVTDGYHFCQFLYKVLFILSLVTYEPIFDAWLADFIIYFGLWQVTFTITYKILSK